MRKYLAELIGTFALVFCGTGAIIINQETNGIVTHAGIAITFGLKPAVEFIRFEYDVEKAAQAVIDSPLRDYYAEALRKAM